MNAAELEAARAEHFRQSPHLALRSNAAAIDFIEQMGLLLLFRSGKLALPNLADACVGGHWEWGADPTGLSAWELKETIPASGRAFYARLIAGRGTFVRWSLVPALLAAWQPERRARRLDELEDLALGVGTLHGPISTRNLRREVQAALPCEGREVRAAIGRLQERLLITVAGGTLEGWSMHEWDLLTRRLPGDVKTDVAQDEARRELTRVLVDLALATKPGSIARMLGWSGATTRGAIEELAADGVVRTDVAIDGLPGRFVTSMAVT